jgi:hypothetical protein
MMDAFVDIKTKLIVLFAMINNYVSSLGDLDSQK